MAEVIRHRLFKGISLVWLMIFIGLSLVVVIVSFAFEVSQAKDSVTSYVAIWEDDIAKATLFEGDLSLQNKILSQLHQVQNSIEKAQVQNPELLNCVIGTDAPITFNSLPAGNIRVCFAPAKLAVNALMSPIFMLGIFVGMIFLGFGFRREFATQLKEQKLESELLLNKEISSMARQVAHDIRGPLTALVTLNKFSDELSTEKRDLFSLSVTRIQAIAEDLLKKGRESQAAFKSEPLEVASSDLVNVVENLLKEYRFSYPQVQWSLQNNLSANVALSLETIKLQRILSNMLNNALEACSGSEALIGISLRKADNGVVLQILDNGCGISEEVLQSLGAEGVSYGKADGNGLGLFDAKKTLNDLGGHLEISSRVGIGTQVTLTIPVK